MEPFSSVTDNSKCPHTGSPTDFASIIVEMKVIYQDTNKIHKKFECTCLKMLVISLNE